MPLGVRVPTHLACRVVDDFLLAKQLYKGKASVLFQAVCRRSTNTVALKLYRKHKLSQLNWFQVQCNFCDLISLSPHSSPG